MVNLWQGCLKATLLLIFYKAVIVSWSNNCEDDKLSQLTSTLTEPLCRSRDARAFLNGVGVLGVMIDFCNTGVSVSHFTTWLLAANK